jgi:hypothetical protein
MTESDKIYELDKIGVRFDQFIIAINGALIAYSIKQIEDELLSWKLIPLGLAITFWGISFYFGISSIRRLISSRIVGVFRERTEIKNNPTYSKTARDILNETGDFANKNNKKMFYFLYLGGISFIVWQVLEMTLRTLSK